MCMSQRFTDFRDDIDCLFFWNPELLLSCSLDNGFEVGAINPLHDNEIAILGLSNVEGLNDVRMNEMQVEALSSLR